MIPNLKKKISIPIYALMLFVFLQSQVTAQSSNRYDECNAAFFIANPENYCSTIGEFSTFGATPSIQANPMCWPQNTTTGDIWLYFRPQAPGVSIRLIGRSSSIPNGITQPSLAVYAGQCGSFEEIACKSISNAPQVIELSLTGLLIGESHYIRIDSRLIEQGDFQLCIDVFKPVPQPDGDCSSSVILCDKSGFVIPSLSGIGNEKENLLGTCIQEEFASTWYKWTCKESGTLTFTLTPTNPNDPEEDLDFAVFRLPNGLNDCANKELLRCEASGESVGNSASQNAPCFGPTGLSESSSDFIENPGCMAGDDNFVAALDMIEGESYALIVNNFSRSGFGFEIEFGGSGVLLGPEPNIEFDVQVKDIECDKSVTFIDSSQALSDMIIDWSWNFGEGSNPSFAKGEGPHQVVYSSFGDKLAALTVESEKGCIVTKIIDFHVKPCCRDTTTLSIETTEKDAICEGEASGEIIAMGQRGSPHYQYSLDGILFTNNTIFSDLATGDYQVIVQDRKGCTDTTLVTIGEPAPFIINAGEDISVELGDTAYITATIDPFNQNVQIMWTREDGVDCEDYFSCLDCLDPEVIAPGNSVYKVEVINEAGCITTDFITINVSSIRPIFIPNIIDLNAPNNNKFIVSTNAGGMLIEEFIIYDRWGNKMYSRTNIPASNNLAYAWNGQFNGVNVNPGVYVWVAYIKFIDKKVIKYTGDLTVIE